MAPDIRVWLEAILQREESPIAADWLKEQPSAVIVSLLEALKDAVERRAPILVWADGTADSEAYFSERHQQWVFTSFIDDGIGRSNRVLPEWVEVRGPVRDEQAEQLNQDCFACDLEVSEGCWVLAPGCLPDILELDPEHLHITRAGTAHGQILSGEEALAWWTQWWS
jgi:hypothetical protein